MLDIVIEELILNLVQLLIINNGGKAVTINQLKPGDIVGFNNHDGKKQPGHVGIFVGNDKYIHSPSKGKVVTYGVLSTNKNFIGGRNYID